MKAEISCAVDFVCSMVQSKVNQPELTQLRSSLTHALEAKYQNHWFPENSRRGSGYRAIHTMRHRQDPLFVNASKHSNIPNLGALLPHELTIWVDPHEVSYRIGDSGSVCELLSGGGTSGSDRSVLTPSPVSSPSRSPASSPPPAHHSATTPRRASPPLQPMYPTPTKTAGRGPLLAHYAPPSHHYMQYAPAMPLGHVRLMPEFMRTPYANVDVYA